MLPFKVTQDITFDNASELSTSKYFGTWELGTPKGLSKTVLNSDVVLFLRSISIMNRPRD